MDPGWIPVKMPSFEATPRSEDTPSLTVVFERSAMAEATAGGFHARGICGRHDQGQRVAAAVLLFLAIICLAPEAAPAQGLCIPPLDALKRAMCSDPELRGLLEIGQRRLNLHPDYALSSAIKSWYKTGTYGCFCGFERWRATRCNFKRGSARPSLLFFTEQRISAGRR